MENVIIIGGGPAGLSAAIYLARADLKPLVFAGSPPGGQLTLTSEVENYPGFESILGSELIERMRNQAKKFGAKIIDENVLNIDFSKKPFKVFGSIPKFFIGKQQTEKNLISSPTLSNSIIIATGAKALWLNLPSETRLRGKGVSACATCDGFFFREKTVAVIGGGDTALEEALTLTKFAKKVYIIHRRDFFRAS
ncbi:MAG: FAD-dependent oxidoreductase, partial [Candidatus Roizmanbacteria bacterium]|nr:FAD-dependent oxidoreductase [Candidatus Roizmanbacteria bacterium]